MSDTLQLEVLTPERRSLDVRAESVYLQGSMGRLGILPRHTALIAKLDIGDMTYQVGGQTHELLCGEGLVEVNGDRVTVLVRSAERRNDIDRQRAKDAKGRAKGRLLSNDDKWNIERAERAYRRADARLRFAGGGE